MILVKRKTVEKNKKKQNENRAFLSTDKNLILASDENRSITLIFADCCMIIISQISLTFMCTVAEF